MNIFRRPDYHSEVTQFIDTLKTAKPTLEAEQRQGRELLWDKKIDRQAVQEPTTRPAFRSSPTSTRPKRNKSQIGL